MAAGVVLLGFLAWQAQKDDRFMQLVREPKRWDMLLLALLAMGLTAVISFVRWQRVAAAAGVPLTTGEALRLGALGYTLNFVSPGSVGGDVFKAAALAKDRPGSRVAVVTTVMVDRILALVSLLIFGAAGFLVVWASTDDIPGQALAAGWTAVGLAVAAPVGLSLLLVVAAVSPEWTARLQHIPLVGGLLSDLLESWARYRHGLGSLASAFALCVVGHVLLVTSFYLVAQGLPFPAPTWLEHVFIAPFGLLMGGLPISPNGLGTVEVTFALFYEWLGFGATDGAFVAFGQRLVGVALAAIALPYYLVHQAAIRRTLSSAEPKPA